MSSQEDLVRMFSRVSFLSPDKQRVATLSPLENLAPELLFMVMETLPDLATLYALICASPKAKRLFDRNATNIVNGLIRDTLFDLQTYPHWIAITGSVGSESSPFAATTMDGFIIAYQKAVGFGIGVDRDNVPALSPALNGTPGPRAAILAAYRVRMLENICLHQMMAGLHALDKGHPEVPKRVYEDYCVSLISIPDLTFKPWPEVWFVPSFVETFRVRKALWQTLSGASVSGVPGMPALGVLRENGEEWCRTLEMPFLTSILVDSSARGYQRGDVYDCVNDTLRYIMGCSLGGMLSREGLPTPTKKLALKNLREVGSWIPQRWEVEELPVETETGDKLGMSRRHIALPNYGMAYYILCYQGYPTSGPLTRQSLRLVSRLGLSIWDTRRLRDVGLALPMETPTSPAGTDGSDAELNSASSRTFAAWRSVFLQTLSRLHGTCLSDMSVPEGCTVYVDAWNTKVVVVRRDASALLTWMMVSGSEEEEPEYDGPLEWEGMREYHSEVVEAMVEEVVLLQDEYWITRGLFLQTLA